MKEKKVCQFFHGDLFLGNFLCKMKQTEKNKSTLPTQCFSLHNEVTEFDKKRIPVILKLWKSENYGVSNLTEFGGFFFSVGYFLWGEKLCLLFY